ALILAVVATLLRWLVFAPLEGHAIAFGFAAWPMGRSLLLQLAWALGFVALLPALTPRPLLRRAVG
ncbi:MAG: hypothetical protein J0H99_11095, partial [Rhodospirillales bacterium]|nr:hypothetical protein [Rhodospirillales bacterium]